MSPLDADQVKEVDIIAVLLDHRAGFGVELFGDMLSVYRLEDGRYGVTEKAPHSIENGSTWHEVVFVSVRDAAEHFVRRRWELKLGFDFEEKTL